MRRIAHMLLLILACWTTAHAAALEAKVAIENRTGRDKIDWPVFLTVWKVFGANLAPGDLATGGFHVYDDAGREIPHMLRQIPPRVSVANDEIIILVPTLKTGESATYRLTHTSTSGLTQDIDLAANPNNLLPNGGFEKISKAGPADFNLTSDRGVEVAPDTKTKREGSQSLRLTLPVGSAITLRSDQPPTFRKDGLYHCSFWAKTHNVAYTGWGFWNQGATVKLEPAALRGRDSIPLRGTRDWYCYSFDIDSRDDWGVPTMTPRTQPETLKKDGQDTPATIWQKQGQAHLVIHARQASQPFLADDKTGTIWLDEMLLFEQPAVTIERLRPLERAARRDAIIFSRPVNMPRMKAFAHEATERLDTFAMPGERRTVRLGVQAIRDLKDVTVELLPLLPPDGKGKALYAEIESLGEYVEPYKPIAALPAARPVEFLLTIPVEPAMAAGQYTGAVILRADKKALAELPLRVEVLPFATPDMQPYLVGGIFNTGMGLSRNPDLYKCYAKTGFNYILLFDYLFRLHDSQIDFAAADRQVEQITKLAGVRDAIGLYREPNMSEDQPRLWYQIAAGQPDYAGPYKIGTDPRYERAYRDLARTAHTYAKDRRWPQLVYMVSDEPGDKRDVNESMGWLQAAVPDAVTIADVQFKDMLATWQWYSLPVFDDPIDWTGPLVYEFVRSKGRPFGFCGTGWALDVARYQPGLMLATSGGTYWHFWHLRGPLEPRGNDVVRSHAVAAMAEGFNDLRYYVLLKQRIAQAERALQAANLSSFERGRKMAHIVTAKRRLTWGFDFATADHDRHLMPYNGTPETWGYDRFYDDWRTGMKESLLQLQP